MFLNWTVPISCLVALTNNNAMLSIMLKHTSIICNMKAALMSLHLMRQIRWVFSPMTGNAALKQVSLNHCVSLCLVRPVKPDNLKYPVPTDMVDSKN